MRNVAGYYASQPPATMVATADTVQSPYDKGKLKAEACVSCHGESGNGTMPGIPSLAGQQPLYFVSAVQSYLDGRRHIETMEAMLRGISKVDMENMAVYFAAQTPAPRQTAAFGDPTAGEPLSAKCGGCHGARGLSHDAATPTLAGQDPQYLVTAMKAYHDGKRSHSNMVALLSDTSDAAFANIAAFYAAQKSEAADKSPLSVSDLAANCDRCHGPGLSNPTVATPKISGQDRDYLIMALRAYRDGKRESSTMHKMSLPYSDTVIESISSWYANQPAK
jgi:cytochrome c553